MIQTINDIVKASAYGGKAYWLSWLHANGYPVPYAVFLPASKEALDENVKSQGELELSLSPMVREGKYDAAVRSSATCEDMRVRSYAGHFQTVIGEMTLAGILDSIQKIVSISETANHREKYQVGVIIQKHIHAAFSGVIFSSDPVTAKRSNCVVSVVEGPGESLVSGRVPGEEIVIRKNETTLTIPSHASSVSQRLLQRIAHIAVEVEERVGYPVDIEWCVEKETESLWILQCRPVTGVFYEGALVVKICEDNQNELPSTIKQNKKVVLRLRAERLSVPISNGYIVTTNSIGNHVHVPRLNAITPSIRCKAYSSVLIYPELLSGKVIRLFSNLQELEKTIFDIARLAAKEYWTSQVIVQEIYDPEFTGMARRIQNGFIINVARGHFVPKGIVPISEYILDDKGKILRSRKSTQKSRYRILDRGVIEEPLLPEQRETMVSENVLASIINTLNPILMKAEITAEFGILSDAKNEPFVYLIDYVEEGVEKVPDLEMVSAGVISRGKITGQLVPVTLDSPDSAGIVLHQHDRIAPRTSFHPNRIFLCDKPNIALLGLLQRCNPQHIGFVFREASTLCHFAITLRENNIPAIQFPQRAGLLSDQIVTVDALTPGLLPGQRLQIHKDIDSLSGR